MKVGVDVKDEPRAGRGESLRTSVVRRLWDVWSDTGRKARAPSCVLILRAGCASAPPCGRSPACQEARCAVRLLPQSGAALFSELAARSSHLTPRRPLCSCLQTPTRTSILGAPGGQTRL